MIKLAANLRIEMFILSIIILVGIVKFINKTKLSSKSVVGIFILSVGLVLISIFPNLIEKISMLFGFEMVSNFLYFCSIVFLGVVVFLQTVSSSRQEEKIKNLIQEISIMKSKNK